MIKFVKKYTKPNIIPGFPDFSYYIWVASTEQEAEKFMKSLKCCNKFIYFACENAQTNKAFCLDIIGQYIDFVKVV